LVLGLFGFLVTRAVASGWGMGAAIGVGVFVAVWAGVLGAVVMVGRWAMRNEDMIRGNESGHAHHEEPVLARSAAHEADIDSLADARIASDEEAPADVAEAELSAPEAEAEPGDAEPGPPSAGSDPICSSDRHGYRRRPCVRCRASASVRRYRPSCPPSSAWP